MADLKIDRGDWIVVCDGAKALVFENAGSRMALDLVTKEVYEHPDPKTHEIGTDRPGRSFQSVGSKRSAMQETNWHRQEEERFLTRLAERLDKAVQSGETKALIVAAPPRALGVLRQKFSPHVRQAVRGELDKDFIKLPPAEIAKHLAS